MTKVHFITQGCSLNNADSQVMQHLLEKAGFGFAENAADSDIVIYNTCTVKGPTESTFRKRLKHIEELKKPIVITGCIAQTEPQLSKRYSVLGVDQIEHIVEVVEETLNGNIVSLLYQEPVERLQFTKKRANPVVEIIPISQGCLGEPCSYCKVKQARGDLHSYSKDSIIKNARQAIKNRAKELWLTAQDTGCYGYDFIGTEDLSETRKYFLPQLVKDIAALPGDFMIRIGMANPNHVKEFLDEFIEILKLPKVFKFVHIPVQAGNNEILERMKRRYTAEEFKQIVHKLRKEIPELTVSTDIIAGFPGETKEQFTESVELVNETKPDILNVSKFWPRPNTAAARMKNKVDGGEIKDRVNWVNSMFDHVAYERNKLWKGWQGEILIDEKGRDDSFIGRNYAYKQVIVRGDFELGQKIKVKVIKPTIYDLRAEVV